MDRNPQEDDDAAVIDDPDHTDDTDDVDLDGGALADEEDLIAIALSSTSRATRSTNVPLNIRASRLLHRDEEHPADDEDDTENSDTKLPLLPRDSLQQQQVQLQQLTPSGAVDSSVVRVRANSDGSGSGLLSGGLVRARKPSHHKHHHHHRRSRKGTKEGLSSMSPTPLSKRHPWLHACLLWCCRNNSRTVQSTISCMNLLAKFVFWSTIVALVGAVFWYSYELHEHGTEPHYIAWFSAGAFVLLGFPISMWGIICHLANYNQPRVQIYIIRILWMVPIYSVESWLAMRYHKKAIYIETFRDFYESYVLYSFLQFLIEVLGGEEALILMLKDKSPTRGFHMWGFQFCIKPWLMGQPVSRTVYERPTRTTRSGKQKPPRAIKRVHWKSPFFVKCKFGVLQYVLLKLVSAIVVLILEWKGWYKEGVFSWRNGYLYVCIITNLSQCWALYCLIFFYYATHNELSPIRPVGKFLSVKALVFFTWWQSVVIAILYQAGMIPEQLVNVEQDWTKEDVAKGIQDYLICVEMFLAAVVHSFVFPHTEYSPQAVEARNRALNHNSHNPHGSSVWNHNKKRLGRSIFTQHNLAASYWSKDFDSISKSSAVQTGSMNNNGNGTLEMMSLDSGSGQAHETWDDPLWWIHPVQPQHENYTRSRASSTDEVYFYEFNAPQQQQPSPEEEYVEEQRRRTSDDVRPVAASDSEKWLATVPDDEREDEDEEEAGGGEGSACDSAATETSFGDEYDEELSQSPAAKPGFVRALLDSAIPRDLGDNTIGLVKGDYHVEKKTLLHHAATSDQYDLFSPNRRRPRKSEV